LNPDARAHSGWNDAKHFFIAHCVGEAIGQLNVLPVKR
jgi:hypothetical protein